MDQVLGGQEVIWRGKEYVTGNRGHGLVELYRNGKFIRVVTIKSIKLNCNLSNEINDEQRT